jgi:hypothetical protein
MSQQGLVVAVVVVVDVAAGDTAATTSKTRTKKKTFCFAKNEILNSFPFRK